MEVFFTSIDALKDIVKTIKKGNPPEGMTRKEWLHEISDSFVKANEFGKTYINQINELHERENRNS